MCRQVADASSDPATGAHCAHLIGAGINVKTISRRFGHASVSFTLDRYGHLMPEADSEAAAVVASLVNGASA